MRSRLKSSCTKREERGLGSFEEVQQPTEAFVCLFSYDIESKLHIINIICLNWFRRQLDNSKSHRILISHFICKKINKLT